ncbi:MAG: LptF/LptG family permease [Phycisphaeraceae bacterium]|nr:LptF/LptG family permease [Phycisphaeraceae bacterium]
MRTRRPLTLWKLLLIEQLRLLALTVSIVVVVIAFATAIDPISDGKLALLDVPKYVLLAIPPMLAYALPFSAGFASTLAYHRFNQDNETIGAYASGIGHRAMLAPALAVGIALTLFLAVLNDQVNPRFVREMQRLITRDLVRMIARSVETGNPVVVGGWVLTADKAYVLPNPPPGYTDQARLTRVVALELGRSDIPDALNVVAVGSSSQADLWLRRVSRSDGAADGSEAIIELGRTVAQPRGDVSLAFAESATLGPIFMPDSFREEPEFLTGTELAGLRRSPDSIDSIAFRKRYLAHALAEPLVVEAIREVVDANVGPNATGEWLRFGFLKGGGRIQLLGRGLRPTPEGWEILPWDADGVRVEYIAPRNTDDGWSADHGIDDRALRRDVRLRARSALIRVNLVRDERQPELTISLELRRTVEDTLDGAGERERLVFASLALAEDDPVARLESVPVEDLLAEARRRIAAQEPGFEQIIRPAGDLENRLHRLYRQITSKSHERIALALSCLTMVATGSLAALRLRAGSPLAVYGLSFLPALFSLIMINGGQHYAHRTGLEGLFIMWLGVAVPAIVALILYRSVARH